MDFQSPIVSKKKTLENPQIRKNIKEILQSISYKNIFSHKNPTARENKTAYISLGGGDPEIVKI